MPSPRGQDWTRRLRPLVLDGEPLAPQLRRRLGVVLVASVLCGALMLFFLALFAGFGHGGIGLIIAAAIAPAPAWAWADHLRLRRAVAAYLAARQAAAFEGETPAGATPREVDPGR